MAGASLALARSQHDFDFQPAGGEEHFVKSIYDFVLIFKVSMIIIPSTTAAKRVLNKWKEHATFCRSAAAWCASVCVCELSGRTAAARKRWGRGNFQGCQNYGEPLFSHANTRGQKLILGAVRSAFLNYIKQLSAGWSDRERFVCMFVPNQNAIMCERRSPKMNSALIRKRNSHGAAFPSGVSCDFLAWC